MLPDVFSARFDMIASFQRLLVDRWNDIRQFLRIWKTYSPLLCSEETNSFPVALQKASKSFTEPGSVARTRKTSPCCNPLMTFFARRMGNGQFNPRASSSCAVVDMIISCLGWGNLQISVGYLNWFSAYLHYR